jgi:hypothetical protein
MKGSQENVKKKKKGSHYLKVLEGEEEANR